MAAVSTTNPLPTTEQPSAMPDYMTDANAVLDDPDIQWRYGHPPDYSKTRKFYSETKRYNHEAGSLPELVENLVKNWEIEASFKTRLNDWRTVDPERYTFAINGHDPVSAEHMLRVGTYNAIITPCDYYDPSNSDFAKSHKTFKRMMPVFAWEVVDVFSPPPVVSFKWRHWGEMKSDYVGWNSAGEKVTVKASGRMIDIEGVTMAYLNSAHQITKLRTWFDSNEMFKQMDPDGVAIKEAALVQTTEPGSPGEGPTVAVEGEVFNLVPSQGCPMMGGHGAPATSSITAGPPPEGEGRKGKGKGGLLARIWRKD